MKPGPKPLTVEQKIERFWAKVDKSDDCWIWTGSKKSNGYGSFAWPNREHIEYAHRVAFIISVRELGAEECVLHHCDNRLCVNPQHLFVGSHTDNIQDMLSKKRGRWQRANPEFYAMLDDARFELEN